MGTYAYIIWGVYALLRLCIYCIHMRSSVYRGRTAPSPVAATFQAAVFHVLWRIAYGGHMLYMAYGMKYGFMDIWHTVRCDELWRL